MSREIYITCGFETVKCPDGRLIGVWILVNGKRVEYYVPPGAFPVLPETWN